MINGLLYSNKFPISLLITLGEEKNENRVNRELESLSFRLKNELMEIHLCVKSFLIKFAALMISFSVLISIFRNSTCDFGLIQISKMHQNSIKYKYGLHFGMM